MKVKRRSIKAPLFYYSFFDHFLPSLSSFLPSSSSININNNIEMKVENKEEKGRRRIRDFLRKKIFFLFTLLYFLHHYHHNQSFKLKIYVEGKYSEEEKEKRNKMIFSNQLIQNQNLLLHFGSRGNDPFTHFHNPHYIS